MGVEYTNLSRPHKAKAPPLAHGSLIISRPPTVQTRVAQLLHAGVLYIPSYSYSHFPTEARFQTRTPRWSNLVLQLTCVWPSHRTGTRQQSRSFLTTNLPSVSSGVPLITRLLTLGSIIPSRKSYPCLVICLALPFGLRSE